MFKYVSIILHMHIFLWGYYLRLSPFWNNDNSWIPKYKCLGTFCNRGEKATCREAQAVQSECFFFVCHQPRRAIGTAQFLLQSEEPRSSVSSISNYKKVPLHGKKGKQQVWKLNTFWVSFCVSDNQFSACT